mmetsp:Transcript_27805/g.70240  ORF Transcript_27805/g.70240 Transcript_27805/m.70240 type:complete len:1454 (-) Transcript_27805:340-4701(-)|eukprot:CAMPEP_0179003524 /NCGR_PEP_ID=MMETSP0795-20121207/12746_1 /TAXON_ID=88552 /ORGANISM="Amoebophrya sp., Strain Ameob2" /LENGTH=1453 /DNA_ID=CAMNT_0020697583 /DNA_START=105 /DNA_END=4466 /DNA_ORIENTATION=-
MGNAHGLDNRYSDSAHYPPVSSITLKTLYSLYSQLHPSSDKDSSAYLPFYCQEEPSLEEQVNLAQDYFTAHYPEEAYAIMTAQSRLDKLREWQAARKAKSSTVTSNAAATSSTAAASSSSAPRYELRPRFSPPSERRGDNIASGGGSSSTSTSLFQPSSRFTGGNNAASSSTTFSTRFAPRGTRGATSTTASTSTLFRKSELERLDRVEKPSFRDPLRRQVSNFSRINRPSDETEGSTLLELKGHLETGPSTTTAPPANTTLAATAAQRFGSTNQASSTFTASRQGRLPTIDDRVTPRGTCNHADNYLHQATSPDFKTPIEPQGRDELLLDGEPKPFGRSSFRDQVQPIGSLAGLSSARGILNGNSSSCSRSGSASARGAAPFHLPRSTATASTTTRVQRSRSADRSFFGSPRGNFEERLNRSCDNLLFLNGGTPTTPGYRGGRYLGGLMLASSSSASVLERLRQRSASVEAPGVSEKSRRGGALSALSRFNHTAGTTTASSSSSGRYKNHMGGGSTASGSRGFGDFCKSAASPAAYTPSFAAASTSALSAASGGFRQHHDSSFQLQYHAHSQQMEMRRELERTRRERLSSQRELEREGQRRKALEDDLRRCNAQLNDARKAEEDARRQARGEIENLKQQIAKLLADRQRGGGGAGSSELRARDREIHQKSLTIDEQATTILRLENELRAQSETANRAQRDLEEEYGKALDEKRREYERFVDDREHEFAKELRHKESLFQARMDGLRMKLEQENVERCRKIRAEGSGPPTISRAEIEQQLRAEIEGKVRAETDNLRSELEQSKQELHEAEHDMDSAENEVQLLKNEVLELKKKLEERGEHQVRDFEEEKREFQAVMEKHTDLIEEERKNLVDERAAFMQELDEFEQLQRDQELDEQGAALLGSEQAKKEAAEEYEAKINFLEAELANGALKLAESHAVRRAQNLQLLAVKSSLQIFCRVRPAKETPGGGGASLVLTNYLPTAAGGGGAGAQSYNSGSWTSSILGPTQRSLLGEQPLSARSRLASPRTTGSGLLRSRSGSHERLPQQGSSNKRVHFFASDRDQECHHSDNSSEQVLSFPADDNKAVYFHECGAGGSSRSSPTTGGASSTVAAVASGTGRTAAQKMLPFSFDAVFPPSAAQADVFEQIHPIIEGVAVGGTKASIFCYGQSGSGKSYTMLGYSARKNGTGLGSGFSRSNTPLSSPRGSPRSPGGSTDAPLHDSARTDPGIAPRAVELLFRHPDLEGEKIALTCLELDCTTSASASTIVNLLTGEEVSAAEVLHSDFASSSAVAVYPATEQEALKFLAKACMRRKTAKTRTNPAGSSRSHLVFQFRFLKTKGVLNLVDLAGCEKYNASDTAETTIAINSSLSTLSRCFRSVAREQKALAPVRESTLTWLLQDCFAGGFGSLAGGAKSYISLVVCLAPEAEHRKETKHALQFAAHCSVSSGGGGTGRV